MSSTSSSARRLRRLLAAAGAAALLTVSGCGSGDSGGGKTSSGIKLVEKGSLSVCTHLSYKPFEYKDSKGQVIGFDMDLANLMAKKLGLKTKIVDIDFASITAGAVFAAKKCDVAMGAITINDERKKAVDFSTPYFSATQALLVKKDSAIADLPDLKGKGLGVQTDTTGQQYAEDKKSANGYEVTVFDDLPTSLTGLQSGRVDGVINDNGPLFDFVKDHPDLAVAKEFDTGEQYGFEFKKSDANSAKLKKEFDAIVTSSVKDGSYKAIYKKWFGSDPKVLPTASGS